MSPLPVSLPDFTPGSVWLIGAGPGDPGLLTLLAVHALQCADVIVHDALVDARIVALARPDAERVPMGKRGGAPSPKQPEINARLVELARRGLRVARLKGGDPFVFGRGAEEALALVEAGVPFRIVPGISAGVGGLAYAGIPVTSRDINSSVCFLTGHDAEGGAPAHDWAALAKIPVLVFYMALRQLDVVSAALIAGGRDPAEAVAVVSRAATERQRVFESTLGEVATAVKAAGIEPPALLVIGEVVRLRHHLNWL
jgi:uroporphyrin-III C-methyltransferase